MPGTKSQNDIHARLRETWAVRVCGRLPIMEHVVEMWPVSGADKEICIEIDGIAVTVDYDDVDHAKALAVARLIVDRVKAVQ